MSTVGPESFPKMEHIHGVDVSWMTHGNPKDKISRRASLSKTLSQQALDIPYSASNGTSTPEFAPASAPTTTNGFTTGTFSAPSSTQNTTSSATTSTTTAKPIPIGGPSPAGPGFMRTASDEGKTPPIGVSPRRRNSWFSNIASKLSSANGAAQSPPQTNPTSPKNAEFSVPKVNPAKNAVLQHATKHEGDGPYIPAPPGHAQGGVFHIFRRLSTSNGTLGSNGMKAHNHGLVERRVLNVDHHRERCDINGLNQAKLRRVAFCVDVEIAPMPRYGDDAAKKTNAKPQVVTTHVAPDGTIMVTNRKEENSKEAEATAAAKAAAETRKKEKKKKSEEERKARKEKKRKLAEANGTIPMEIHVDSDSSDDGGSTAQPQQQPPQQQQPESSGRRTQSMPTTNPVRIYRRCCQLRETPILKRITEQLMDPANMAPEKGVVEKLDLTGYWLQLPDLVTLGDYLAVVPIKEVILDNCGLSDEGLRVILAGLLAARKNSFKRRKQQTGPDGPTPQGGVVERLILKNNKIGAEGWKHICLFVYLCHTLKVLDLSQVPFPQPTGNDAKKTMDLCQLFSKSLGERLGGSTLTLLSLGETGITTEQLGLVMDGVLKCGIKKIVLANNHITDQGLAHVKRFLATPACEGLDLGGNDLREHIDKLTEALDQENCPLWALSLADCNLTPAALSQLLPTLVKLPQLRFIDLSHNQELFNTEPSAVAVLRKYLPAMPSLKRIHLVDCALTPEQVIALAEILPEIPGLAHVSLLENPQIVELTDANTDEAKESACALFASLLSAARVSRSLVAVDIEVPNEQSSDLVKAMAKQVVAYCLRNMGEHMAVGDFSSMTGGLPDFLAEPEYPDVLQRLVGADVTQPYDPEEDLDIAPDEDYVIGGTGVVKALICCLDNCDEEFRTCCLDNNCDEELKRQSGEFVRDGETGHVHTKPHAPVKAKETSKHLLLSARKIRTRLQPAIQKARYSHEDTHAYHRLIFLDNTLKGIIKRFEDEFPDTKEVPASTTAADSASFISSGSSFTTYPYDDAEKLLGTSISSIDLAPFTSIWGDDADDADDAEAAQAAAFGIKPRGLVRSNSSLSLSSRALADEEARVLRAGHKFRSGIVKPEHYMLLNCGVEMIGEDPNHARLLHELFDELDDDEYTKMVDERGAVEVFIENKEDVVRKMRELDPAHWDRFVESQEMARMNVEAPVQGNAVLADKCEANMKSLNAAGTGAQGTSELTMRLKGEKEKEKVAKAGGAAEQK